MGLDPSPDIYQERCPSCSSIWRKLRYFDEILVLGFDSFKDHLLTLQEVFTGIRKANLQENIAKSKFEVIEIEFL